MSACAKFAAACILGAALGSQGTALAAELIILTNQGATPGVRELAAAFERASGHKVTVIQEEGTALEERLNNGPADLITGNPGPIESLVKNGKVVDINPIQAMLNPSTPYETIHMILACYVATGFGVAAVYAFGMLRGKRDDYHRKGLMLAMAMGVIAIQLQIISGDANARFLVDAQPAKLAAIEGVFKTQQGAPLEIGGLADPGTGKVIYALEIPRGLSILATFNPNSTIKGLDAFAPADRPNPLPIHTSFDGMVASGFFALFVALLFWFLYFLKKRIVPTNRVMLWGIVLAGPLSFLAIELGWMVTEFGRQPWVIYGYLRTKDAVTTAPWLNISFLIFTLIYVLLSVALTRLLLGVARSPLPKVEMPGNSQQPEKAGV